MSERSRTHFDIDRMCETHPSLSCIASFNAPVRKNRLVPDVPYVFAIRHVSRLSTSHPSSPSNQRSRRSCTSSARSDPSVKHARAPVSPALGSSRNLTFRKPPMLAKRVKRGLRPAQLYDLIPLPRSIRQATRLCRVRKVNSFLNAQLSTIQPGLDPSRL